MASEMIDGFIAGKMDANSGGGCYPVMPWGMGGWGMGGMMGGWGEWFPMLIIAALIFGNGAGFGFGGGGAALQGIATRADINEGFALQNITGGIQGLVQGLADATYALNNTITNGFHGVDSALCNVGHQISDCCCQTQNAIQNVRYDMATQACDTRNLIQNVARDITDNQNANTRQLMDFLVNDKISTLTAEIIRRLGRDCPVPAYVVPNPNCCYGNPAGVGYGLNGGCGCGC